MKTTHHISPVAVPQSGGAATRFLLNAFALPETAIDTLRTWQRRYEDRQHLAEMPAERLADIGITREAALEEASKPVWTA